MEVVSPNCLVAPGYVAQPKLRRPNIGVVSPQHISCVAPTSKLCRPIIKIMSPHRSKVLTLADSLAVLSKFTCVLRACLK